MEVCLILVITTYNATVDHKPSNATEKNRIINNGGEIKRCRGINGHIYGPLRVFIKANLNYSLPMTRSIGDKYFWEAGVTSNPDIFSYDISSCLFIVLGSDGIWEFLNSNEVSKIVYHYYRIGQLKRAATSIVSQAYELWENEAIMGIDDITAIVVGLREYQ